jgi:uncharacterized protein YecE (DUF72 family)
MERISCGRYIVFGVTRFAAPAAKNESFVEAFAASSLSAKKQRRAYAKRNEKAWKKSISNFGKEQAYEQQSERYDYLYLPGELLEIERTIREVLDKVKKVFVILNNHPKGSAVANAFELLHLLNERIKLNIPETTLKTFPRLSKISLN